MRSSCTSARDQTLFQVPTDNVQSCLARGMPLFCHCPSSLPLLLESVHCLYHWSRLSTDILEPKCFEHLGRNRFVKQNTDHAYTVILNHQIGSIHFSILAGRILLKDVHYHSSNQTIKLVKGQISWRYWIRKPTTEEDISYVGGEAGISPF